jgi:hypothetical protein
VAKIPEETRAEMAQDMARGAYVRKLLEPGFIQSYPRADKYVEEWWEETYLPFVASDDAEANMAMRAPEVDAEVALIEEAIAEFVAWREKYPGKLSR